jgi:molecular chaperone GrpE
MRDDEKAEVTDAAEKTSEDAAVEATQDAAMADTEADTGTGTDTGTEADTGTPEETLEDKLAAANDQLLRALAELENTRRRAERDRGEALKYGAMSFARDMVGVADNLQRALKAIEDTDAAAKADLPEAVQALLEGVAATERDLLAALGRHKVTPLAPLGEKFDPNLHEALFEAPGTGQEAGTIIDVIETGFMMQERLLRPAKVGIAKD